MKQPMAFTHTEISLADIPSHNKGSRYDSLIDVVRKLRKGRALRLEIAGHNLVVANCVRVGIYQQLQRRKLERKILLRMSEGVIYIFKKVD